VEGGLRLLVKKGKWTVGMKNEEMNEFAKLSIVHFAERDTQKEVQHCGRWHDINYQTLHRGVHRSKKLAVRGSRRS